MKRPECGLNTMGMVTDYGQWATSASLDVNLQLIRMEFFPFVSSLFHFVPLLK